MVILAVGFLTLRNGGIGWAADWVTWLIVLGLSVLGVLFVAWGSGGEAAGTDWLRDGKNWIKTYELKDIQLGVPRSKDTLVLTDVNSRKIGMSLMRIQTNPDLWDLVYNGMLHSVYYNGATINERAREKLRLDPQLHLIYDDEL
ncbi:MAG: hypothetical protein ACRDOO_10755 [Actinomadura sp.]